MHLGQEELSPAIDFVKSWIKAPPEFGLVLGSGLGALAQEVDAEAEISYSDIPGFIRSRIPGHAGKLIAGKFNGKRVLVFSGRVHLYEGHSYLDVTLPVRLLKGLGARAVILTTSVGGINPVQSAGDFMLVSDHINFQKGNPLLELLAQTESPSYEGEQSPFLDQCSTYRTDVFKPLRKHAQSIGARLHKGVLAAVMGPVYETPAEVRMFQILGADAVCMSTVPEAIMARYLGLEVVALAQITNAAHAQLEKGPTHAEVLATSEKSRPAFISLMKHLIGLL